MIRPAILGDAAEIAAVHVASWHETYAATVPEAALQRNTEARRRALWERVLAEAARDVFVATEHGAVVGFVCGGAMPDSIRGRAPIPDHDAYVDALYVLAAGHRRGMGRTLLGTLARRLAARGFRSLALHVVADNPARGFYERLGARFIKAERFADGVDEGVQLAYGWANVGDVPTGTSVDGSTAGR
jgi:ribosomal protein S18 acetylase RimI-like enzyme